MPICEASPLCRCLRPFAHEGHVPELGTAPSGPWVKAAGASGRGQPKPWAEPGRDRWRTKRDVSSTGVVASLFFAVGFRFRIKGQVRASRRDVSCGRNGARFFRNFIPGSYRPPLGDGQPPLSEDERAFLDASLAWADAGGAYGHIQRTRPQTLAYALTDSPVGLAAWIVEKFRAWSDYGGNVERAFTMDTLLTNISIYWFTSTIGSSIRLYRESGRRPLRFAAGEHVSPPWGVAAFPHELPMPPCAWVERVYNVARWPPMPRGGHFAAMEAPELLAEEIRAFFRPLRA